MPVLLFKNSMPNLVMKNKPLIGTSNVWAVHFLYDVFNEECVTTDVFLQRIHTERLKNGILSVLNMAHKFLNVI